MTNIFQARSDTPEVVDQRDLEPRIPINTSQVKEKRTLHTQSLFTSTQPGGRKRRYFLLDRAAVVEL